MSTPSDAPRSPSFAAVGSGVSFPDIERDVLGFWKKKGVFETSLAQTAEGDPFVFYDGPPFATGLPHYGHLLAGTIKDIVPRYRTMRGNHVERRFGWDCHGLPVENEMEKELKVSGKKEIESLGIHVFNEACRSIVLRYTSQWRAVVERMGRWVDFENQYRTMDPAYMESIWWVFAQVWKKELIYRGFRVQPYCPRCATPLSNFEVNEGYRDVRGPSITVTMPLADDPTVSLLVWTTTPWTLPSNVACAVGPDIPYVKVRDRDRYYILARQRLGAYYKDPSDYEIVEEMSGRELAGVAYTPLFDWFSGRSERFFKVTVADFVSTDDGTGIVHIAPAFGEDDFGVGAALDLPIVCPVDEEGRFTDEVPPWEGRLVFEADPAIISEIKRMGRLVHRGTIEHRYPFCYRCDTPLMYKAITTWFMKIGPLKETMQAGNRTIHWVPAHLQEGRFGKGIASAPDWNISRNRYWGTPLPVWECDCGHVECVGSIADLHTLAGSGDQDAGAQRHAAVIEELREDLAEKSADALAAHGMDVSWAARLKEIEIPARDIHRHVIDRLPLVCPVCGRKGMQRTPEVLDCWFESGSMPYAQLHYPFERAEEFTRLFPASFIAEGLDQTRGWFYTLTVLAAALFQKPAFRNVVVNGIILSEEGKKLSKRLKNYAPPQEILDKLGADALRLFLVNSPAVKAEDLRFSEKGVTEMARAVLLPFWNAYSFFVTYANVDDWDPDSGETPPRSTNELDRWIISLLNHLIRSVTHEMDEYNLYRVVPNLVDFIDNLTNWYIRRSRRRFWKSENDDDKGYAYATLYYVLVEFSRVMAPFLPFLTEAVYRNLAASRSGAPCSVHLCEFPVVRSGFDEPELETKMDLVRQTVGMGRTLRSRYTIKTRQPLARLTVIIRDATKRDLLAQMTHLIMEELNVKEVVFEREETAVVTLSAKANFKKLGPHFGKRMKEAAALIQEFSQEQINALLAGSHVTVLGRDCTLAEIEIRRDRRPGVEVETRDEITVALDTEITPQLRQEGVAREFVNRVQNLRKSADFAVTDRITVTAGADASIREAVEAFSGYVCSETLAETVVFSDEVTGSSADINGTPVTIHVARV